MDINYYRKYKDVYSRKLRDLELYIERAKAANENKDRLYTQLAGLKELSGNLDRYVGVLRIMQSRAVKENDDFRTARLGFLSGEITESLADIFPEDGYRAEVTCSFNRKNSVKLTITDEKGSVFSPSMCSGKLQQYLISFSSISCITKTLGIKVLYVDEAFGASSMDNLPKIGDCLEKLVEENDMQVILVSQNPGLYQGIKGRREIHLATDRENTCVLVEKILDF